MRVLVKDFDGTEFFGFQVGAADLIAVNQTTDDVKRVRGSVARYAIELLNTAWQDSGVVDDIIRELPGSWQSPKAAHVTLSANADAIALAA